MLPDGGIIGKYDLLIMDIKSEENLLFIKGKAVHKISPDFKYAIILYEKDIKCC